MILSLSLIVGCSGGNGGGGNGGDSGDGGGSDNGGSGNGGGPGDSPEAQWSITPFTDGLRIEWHNLASFSQANNLQRISINITEQDSEEVRYSIDITDFVDGIYNLTSLGSGMDLQEGEAYKFTSLVLEYSDNSTGTVTIDWQLPANESDHGDAGNGTVVGEDHDRDGWANSVDPDDDNDDISDGDDNCPATANSNQLDTDNDTTGDVCDGDKDGDSVANDDEVMGCELLVDCDGDSLLDNHRTEQLVNDNGTSCSLLENCDGDSLLDNHRTEQLMNNEGISCSLLADCDNDTVGDNADNCPTTANSDQLDTDNDTTGDVCDGDKDGDSVANGDEVMGCELLADCDSDTVGDNADNCPATANSDQLDTDNDTTGDVCDGDKDGDSVANDDEVMGCELLTDCDSDMVGDNSDNCPATANSDQLDTDNDDIGDVCDGDKDGDGVDNGGDVDADGDGLIEVATAAELDAVRHQLNGTGFVATAGVQPNQTGCGDGGDITACNGYELIRDISLTDYIAENYAMVGWQPIAHDTDGRFVGCQGDAFSGIFDGNGFEISGLWINRSQQDCIGLFGHTDGSIRNLGVMADRIMGKELVGSLAGDSSDASIVESYAVNGEMRGIRWVGGLVGDGQSASIIQSYAVSNLVNGGGARVGGLVGNAAFASIVQSYAVSGVVNGSGGEVGGLVGNGDSASIVQSYAVSDRVRGHDSHNLGGLVGYGLSASIVQSYAVSGAISTNFRGVGGLVGLGRHSMITQSYAVSGPVSGFGDIGGLVGHVSPGMATATDTYWATDTSGRTNDGTSGSLGQTSSGLRSPTGYDGIYAGWDDGLMVDTINDNATIWCDEDNNDMIEEDERRDDTHADGDNRIWDFGTASDYPAIRCTVDSPADQRAWWSLNSTGQPAINQDRLDAWLDGSLP